MSVPQTDVEAHTSIRLHVKNQGTITWFDYTLDMMRNNNLKKMKIEISNKCNLFTFLTFKKLKEATNDWLKQNNDNQHYGKIIDINKKACKIYDEIKQTHKLNDYKADKYEKQVPEVIVRTQGHRFHIVSADWLDEWIRVGYSSDVTREVEGLHEKIIECFRVFDFMVFCQIERKIRNMLFSIEQATFKDSYLRGIKTAFDKDVTLRILDLEEWIHRTGCKTNPDGEHNPDYILGMENLTANWDLTLDGRFAQAFVTKQISENAILEILGIENRPYDYGKNTKTGTKYDADLCLKYDNSEFPVQVSVREGDLARELSKSTLCIGEKLKATEASSKLGGVNIDYGKQRDFMNLCKKLEQTPPRGILLWASLFPLLPMSGLEHLKEWYGKILDKKCIVLWESNNALATIHHNNTGFDLTHAEKLCNALGVAKPTTHTDSPHSLDRDYFLEMDSNDQKDPIT